jgi:DNA primase
VDVEKVLIALDLPLAAQRGNEVNGLCPMHKKRTGKDDHRPSWWINLLTGAHICFSCGYKGNLYTLVRDLKGVDYYDAKEYIEGQEELPIDSLLSRIKDLPQYIQPEEEPIGMSEARLAVYSDPPAHELKKRFLTIEAAHHHGVLWNVSNMAWILPIRNAESFELMGWQEKGASGRFFKNQPAGVKKSKTVFGVEVMATDILVVVESPLDVVRLRCAGVEGAISTFGAIVSEEQVKIMRRADKVIAAFDSDAAGIKANESMRPYARKYGLNLFFFDYSGIDVKDPGDMGVNEIHKGIENAKSYILGKEAYSVHGNS